LDQLNTALGAAAATLMPMLGQHLHAELCDSLLRAWLRPAVPSDTAQLSRHVMAWEEMRVGGFLGGMEKANHREG
jgi:hypothetical protein